MSHIFDCLDGVSSRDRLAIFNHHHQAAGNQPKEAAAFNLLVVNQYQMGSNKPEDYTPWHDDTMKEVIHRSDEDAAAAPAGAFAQSRGVPGVRVVSKGRLSDVAQGLQ